MTAKVYKPCDLSFFISLSLFYVCPARSRHCLSLSSFTSLASLHSQSGHTRAVRNFHKTRIDRQSYYIDLYGVPLPKCEGARRQRVILSFFISFSFHVWAYCKTRNSGCVFAFEKDFIAITMYSKRRFGCASVYRWTVNALRPTKFSLGMARSVSLLRRGPVLCSHRFNQVRFCIF